MRRARVAGRAAEASAARRDPAGRAAHDFYDFEAKYLDDACEFDVPAELPAPVDRRACGRWRSARSARWTAQGLARVDFFVRPTAELIVNEVNTMPGFTPISMFPRMWAASGLDYPAAAGPR